MKGSFEFLSFFFFETEQFSLLQYRSGKTPRHRNFLILIPTSDFNRGLALYCCKHICRRTSIHSNILHLRVLDGKCGRRTWQRAFDSLKQWLARTLELPWYRWCWETNSCITTQYMPWSILNFSVSRWCCNLGSNCNENTAEDSLTKNMTQKR